MGLRPEVETGAYIAVFWDLDRKWYNAEVLNYDPVTGLYRLLYTDGEREELDLTAVKYMSLWGGKLRERMGKAGGDISKKQSIEYIVKTLVDVEDRLPPRGVHNNKKRWWSAWHSRVTNAGKSGNIAELAKSSVEIAFQMKDNVSTSWWKSQRLNWQKEVESSTTSAALSSRLTDLLTKAVDWNVARQLFSSELSESDRKKSIVGRAGRKKRILEGGQDPVSMDRSGADEKGTNGSRPSAREQRMMEREKRDSKNDRELDDDSGVKMSTSNSAELAVRRSKRKHIVEDNDELSHVDLAHSDAPDVNLMIAENRPSIVKRRKCGKVDEGRHSDPIQHKLDKAHSEIDTNEDQSSVDETKRKQSGRKRDSMETRKHEQGTEDAQGSAIDVKADIGHSRVRRSQRSLGSERSEAGQMLETTASDRKVASASNELIVGAGNSIDIQQREESTELKDTTITIRSPSLRTRSSVGAKSEFMDKESRKVSRHEESSPAQECGTVKDGPQPLEQVSDVQIPRKRGRPKRTRTYQLEKEDDGDVNGKIRNSAESPGTSAAKNVGLSAQDSNDVPGEAIVTRVETTLQKARDTEDGIDCSGDTVGRVKRIIKYFSKFDAADESFNPTDRQVVLSAQDTIVVPREAIDTPVETRLPKAGLTEDGIDRSGDSLGQVDRIIDKPQKYDAAGESMNPADDHVGVSAEDSNVAPREAIVTRVETRLQKEGHTEDEIARSGDSFGQVDRIIDKTQKYDAADESINPADEHVGVSAEDSNVVPRDAIVTQVETRRQQAGHIDGESDLPGDPVGRVKTTIRKPQRYDVVDDSLNHVDDHVSVPAEDSNVVPREAAGTRVETRLQKVRHTGDEIGSPGVSVGRVKRIIKKPQRYDSADESLNPGDDRVAISAQDSNFVPREAIVAQVETRPQNAGHTEDKIGRSGDPVGRVKRIVKKPQKYDAAEESLKPHKVQNEEKQGRIGTRVEVTQINISTGADDVRAGKEYGNNCADEEKLSLGPNAMEPGEGEDGAEQRPSMSDSSADVRQTRRGRLARKGCESKLNDKQGVQGIDPSLLQEAEPHLSSLKQVKEHSFGTPLQDGYVKLEKETDGDGEVQELQGAKPADAAVEFKDVEAQQETSEELDPVNGVSRERDPLWNGFEFKHPSLLQEAEPRLSSLKQVKEHSLGTPLQDGYVKLGKKTDGDGEVQELQGAKPADPAVELQDLEAQQETSEELDPVNGVSRERDPLWNGFEFKQKRDTASMARSERRRVRSGGARLEVLDENETEESSGEEEPNRITRFTRSGKRNSRKIQRSQSFDINYEETTSGASSQEDSEEYKVEDDEDDEEEPEIMAREDSWGERLPTDDSDTEDDAPSQSELNELQLGQAALSLEQPATSQDLIVDEKCSVCDFAGADELMLLCDQNGCTCAFHTFCLTPPLTAIPEGEWFCPKCTRVRANPSDTRRLSKTCSTVKYPSKVVGSIIGRRREPSQEEEKTKIQYLVKWDSLSHEHDTWVPEDWLLFMHNRLVTIFQRKYSLLSDSNFNVDERRPEWLQVDRIIACRKPGSKVPVKPSQVSALLRSRQEDKSGVEFLVKWQTLEHKCATWEQERNTDEFQQAIACYTKRHERVEESGSMEEETKPVPAIKMQPDYLCGGMMYTFQLHGLKWLLSNFEQGRSVILADEMGLGKTIQALALISCVRYEKLSSRPVLVIAPKSTLPGWEQEFRSWAPGLNVIVYQGDKENRALIREHEFHSANKKPLFEVLLTSYELAAFDNTLLSRFHWASLIVDEGHRVKNVRSKLGTLLKRHKADFRLLLTGTPVQNTLTELFALFHFLDPNEFPDPEASARQFTEMDVNAKNGQTDSKVIEQQVARLHELLNPRMLRRLKTEVLRDMIPGKKVVEVSCALTPLQRHLYTAILKRNFKVLNKGVKSGMKRSLQVILTDLKMVCNHPYLFPGKEPQQLEPSKAFKMLVAASGKLQLLEKLLPLLKEQGHRVLLFSQRTKMLDILEDFLVVLGLSYARIDGSCSARSRQASIEEFNSADSRTFIFLISTRAGGLGINLPTADTVIIYDPDFNPFVDLQAQARAHRIGQDKTVLVYQLITKCSVEEKILERSRKKLAMENLVMSKEWKENAADINTLLLHGAQKVLDKHDIEATSIKFTDESVKKLLDREVLTSTADDEPTVHGYLGAVQGAGFSSPTVHEQEDKESKGGDGNEWHELLHHLVEKDEQEELGRGKRVRKQVVYAVEGHPEGQEEDEYNPSSNDSESSSDSELSLDAGGKWKAASARRQTDRLVGDLPTLEHRGMHGMLGPMPSMVQKAGPAGLFVPGGANVSVNPWHLNSPLHASMLSARGNTLQMMGSPANMVLPLPSHGTASFGVVDSTSPLLAAKLRDLGTIGGVGSSSIASLPCTSGGATSSHLGPRPTNWTMLGDQSSHIPAEPVAPPSTTLLLGPGLNNTHFVSSPVPFPGVYPNTNKVNPYAVPSYPGMPVPPYTVRPLPSHPLPSQFLLTDGRVDPQNLTTGNPAWATFSHLQQASQGWRIADVEQMSAPAVAGISWSAGRGYMLSGHHGSAGGHQLPTTSSSTFQSTPSVQSGRGAAHQPLPNSVKNKRVNDSSRLSSAAAAPWLAGYCTVSNSLSRQVEPKVISPSLATPPIPVPAVPVMQGAPYVPTVYPAFEFHDPTVLQVPPAPINMSAPIRVPESHASIASAVVHSVPPAVSSKGTVASSCPHPPIFAPPHLDFVRAVPSLDRNVSSCIVSSAEAPFFTLPHVGAADSMPAPHLHNRYSKNRNPGSPVPQTLQSSILGRAVEVPTSETGAHVVDIIFLGGVPTGHSQPALAAVGKQTINAKGSNILSAHQLGGSSPAVSPQMTPQSRKPLWVPQGDAGLLMGHLQDQGGLPSLHIKAEEGSSQERTPLRGKELLILILQGCFPSGVFARIWEPAPGVFPSIYGLQLGPILSEFLRHHSELYYCGRVALPTTWPGRFCGFWGTCPYTYCSVQETLRGFRCLSEVLGTGILNFVLPGLSLRVAAVKLDPEQGRREHVIQECSDPSRAQNDLCSKDFVLAISHADVP